MDFQSLVELAPWTTIAQICNLLLQIFLFKKFLFKPIKEIIAKRQAEVDGVYDEAEKAREDAANAKTSYEQHLLTAKEEADAITTRAMKNAREHSPHQTPQMYPNPKPLCQPDTHICHEKRVQVTADCSVLNVSLFLLHTSGL